MAAEEKSRLRNCYLLARHEKEKKELNIIKLKNEKELQNNLLTCNFEFSENDFDSFLKIFVMKCHTFESRDLGPLGWQSYPGDIISFLEFKIFLKKQFDMKLNSNELGALIMFCYPSGKIKNNMSCRIFITLFLQNKVATENFKGRSDENVLIQKYILLLKESYLIKIKKIEEFGDVHTVVSKPWRKYVILFYFEPQYSIMEYYFSRKCI